MFISSGRVGELVNYWLFLHPDESMLVSLYCTKLKDIEIGWYITHQLGHCDH